MTFIAFFFSRSLPALLTFLFLVTAHALSTEEALEKSKGLSQRLEWQRLLNYRKTIWGGWESEADGKGFFLAKDGKTNPQAELEALIRAGFTSEVLPPAREGAVSQTARCRYPARWNFIAKELRIAATDLPANDCKDFIEFRDRLSAKSATLIFSGYYVNNPSSAFGHTLLRINRGDRRVRGSELLDTGVNYAAVSTTQNPLLYTFYGLAGGFDGAFSAMPYYYKVREYSDAESRDLWEYDLELTQEELQRLIEHLWELGSTEFNYFYLTENCAYHLLAALEAAAPRLELLKRIPFYVIPADAIKAVTSEPGFVSRIQYRPSTARTLNQRYNELSKAERKEFLRIRKSGRPADQLRGLDPVQSARVLDTVLDELDHRYFRELVLKENSAIAEKKQNVLIARSKLPSTGRLEIPVTEKDQPNKGHGSGRWSVSGGQFGDRRGDTSVVDLELRFALHDLYDPRDGYLDYSVVEFWKMQGRWYPERERAELKAFTLVTASSLLPVTPLTQRISWRVQIGMDRVHDKRCDNCLETLALGYGGASFEPLPSLLTYFLAGPTGETSSSFANAKFLLSGAGLAGLRYQISESWLIGGEAEWRYVFDRDPFDRVSGFTKLRYNTSTRQAFELQYTGETFAREIQFKYLRYF